MVKKDVIEKKVISLLQSNAGRVRYVLYALFSKKEKRRLTSLWARQKKVEEYSKRRSFPPVEVKESLRLTSWAGDRFMPSSTF